MLWDHLKVVRFERQIWPAERVRHLLAARLGAADLLLQFVDALAQHGDLLSLKAAPIIRCISKMMPLFSQLRSCPCPPPAPWSTVAARRMPMRRGLPSRGWAIFQAPFYVLDQIL